MRFDVEPQPWEPDEDATATINYTQRHDGAPEGRAAHAPQHLAQRHRRSAGSMGVSDRDVYLHTLPQFHCNGWGMLYAVTGMGAKHVIMRKVDGAEILRRVDAARRHADVRRAGGAEHDPRRGSDVGGPDPRPRS